MSQSPQDSEAHKGLADYVAGWKATMRMVRQGRSFSGFERNCVFLNCGGARFANVSAATGLDYADDGRAMSIVDWDHDGDLDLWLHNRTGPRLRLMLNETHSPGSPSNLNFVAFKLQGTTCNRDAIGARVMVQVPDPSNGQLIQTLHAGDGFISQSSKWLHFGLGRKPRIEQVVVRWPGGQSERFTDVHPGRRYVLVQGDGRSAEWGHPKREIQLAPSKQSAPPSTQRARIFLPIALEPPVLRYASLEDGLQRGVGAYEGPLLINLWASWCPPCITELKEFAEHKEIIDASGLNVLALSVDGLSEQEETRRDDAKRLLTRIRFPFDSGVATGEMLDKARIMEQFLFDQFPPFAVPMSLLLDHKGRLAAIYRGPVSVDALLQDVAKLNTSSEDRLKWSQPFPGRLYNRPDRAKLLKMMAAHFMDSYVEDYIRYSELAIHECVARRSQGGLSEQERRRLDAQLLNDHNELALVLGALGRLDEAIHHFREALRIASDSATIHANLGSALATLGKFDEAIRHYRRALDAQPEFANVHYNLGTALASRGHLDEAIHHYREAVRIAPNTVAAHINLAFVLRIQGRHDQAMKHFRRALQLDPDRPDLHNNLAQTLMLTGQTDKALPHLGEVARLEPNSPAPLNNMAWILATHSEAKIRDSDKAVHLAERAAQLTHNKDAQVLDTLAAAYASAGRFDLAVTTAQKALEWANATQADDLADDIREHLALYQQEKPIRELP